MQTKTRANIELAAQIVIAIAVVIAAGALVKRSFFPTLVTSAFPMIKTGERLSIPNIKWEQNQKSLVFFLKKDCPYCSSSAPFYHQLIDEANKRNVKCLAVFPNSADEALKYLRYIDLPIDNIQTASLADNKITGTPTVLFVDHQGIVRSIWFGAPAERETEMRNQLIQLFDATVN